MAKLANKLPYASDDHVSGVRRAVARARPQRSAAKPRRQTDAKPVLVASAVLLALLSMWLWTQPGDLAGLDANARIVAKSLPLSAAATAEPRLGAARPNVELEVIAWPPEVQLLLDGAPLLGNPFSGTFPNDGRLHSLRAEGPGLQAQELGITFDRDRVLRLTLSAQTRTRGTGRRAQDALHRVSNVPSSAAAHASDTPLAPRKRAHEIYEEDPYR